MSYAELTKDWLTSGGEEDISARVRDFLARNVGPAVAVAGGLAAKGGSQTGAVLLGPALMGAKALPMTATVTWAREGDGVRVTARFVDTYALKFPGLFGIAKYEKRFKELAAKLQAILPPQR